MARQSFFGSLHVRCAAASGSFAASFLAIAMPPCGAAHAAQYSNPGQCHP